MMGLIDLNTVDDDETPSSGTPSSSSASSASSSSSSSSASLSIHSATNTFGGGSSSVCLELWHACAGPLISLPKKGSVVVYFPQGHLEHVSDFHAVPYDLPPHVFCRVLEVKLHAEVATDEVYAQVSLVPQIELEQKLREVEIEANGDEEDIDGAEKSTTPHMFCKTLTASDTSTHGGFSVPRRAAEDCFPPLDYKQQRPSQELVAKDLHGLQWRFRHIYRGQPRRHLLTTGWSAFVNKKKLVSGDAVLFLRGDDGELRLGIRRAAQMKNSPPLSIHPSQQLNVSNFPAVAKAISTRSVFSIYYNPRASLSEFIIPFHKFSKSLDHRFSAGMRFKMRFETEDAAERRYTGLVTGMSDMDSVRWPGSKWRCLLVRWDDVDANRLNRVSPWEIEPSGSMSSSCSLMAPGSKRTRIGLPSSKPELPLPNGIGMPDIRESLRFQKVLQGQEIVGFSSPYDGIDAQNHHPSELRRCFPGSNSSGISVIGNSVRNPIGNSDISYNSMGFGESLRFHKVLQGQEKFLNPPYRRMPAATLAHEHGGLGIFDGFQMPASRNGFSTLIQGYNGQMRPPAQPGQVSSPSSVLMFQPPSSPVPNFYSRQNVISQEKEQEICNRSLNEVSETYGGKLTLSSPGEHGFRREDQGGSNGYGLLKEHDQCGPLPFVSQSALRVSQDIVPSCKTSCKLFGFSLTEERHATSNGESSTPITSPLNPGTTFLPHFEKQLHPKPPIMTRPAGSNCTKGSELYAVRDTLLDIAL